MAIEQAPASRLRPMLPMVAPLLPYVAVLIGLHLLHSAWGSILMYHAAAGLILVVTGTWHTPLRQSRPLSRAFLAVVLIGSAAIGPMIYAVWSRVRLSDLVLGSELRSLGLDGVGWILFAVYYFTVNPVVEEQFWRGYLGSPRRSIAGTDAWFAGYHVFVLVLFVGAPWIAVSFVGLIGAAWIWRQLANETGSLLVPILSHAIADASLITAALVMTQ